MGDDGDGGGGGVVSTIVICYPSAPEDTVLQLWFAAVAVGSCSCWTSRR